MRLHPFSVGRTRGAVLATTATVVLSLFVVSGAQAVGGLTVAKSQKFGLGWHAAFNPRSSLPSNQAESQALRVAMQLMPESLKSVLRTGILVAVRANETANGIATVSIPRKLARRAHIKAGSRPWVAIGRGTVRQVRDGTVLLHLHLSRVTATKLKGLGHVAMTVRLSLYGLGGHVVLLAAGSY